MQVNGNMFYFKLVIAGILLLMAVSSPVSISSDSNSSMTSSTDN